MRNIRTDLAVEAHEARYGDALCDGVTKNFSNVCGFEVTELNISEKAAAELGKPKGTYLSAEFGRLGRTATRQPNGQRGSYVRS